jgi:hypothetical protein
MDGFKASLQLLPPKVNVSWKNPVLRAKADLALLKGMRQGARAVTTKLEIALDQAMDSSIWNWTGMTLRNNGSQVFTPRNIVDMGDLKASRDVRYAHYPNMTAWTIKYNSPYANITHYGGYIQPYGNKSASAVYLPPRPWVESVLKGGNGITKVDLRTPYGKAIEDAWASM